MNSHPILSKFKNIKSFVFDVDGVFTKNEILVTENGQMLRTMNVRDGYAVKKALELGYHIFIITGGKSEGVALRMKFLGIEEVHSGIGDKLTCLNELIQKYQLNANEILYMGDDLPDYEVMQIVGLPCCPIDAIVDIQNISTYISPFTGGNTCVRDVIEKVMRLNNHWPNQESSVTVA